MILLQRVKIQPDADVTPALAAALTAAEEAIARASDAFTEAMAAWEQALAADPTAPPPPEPQLVFGEARALCEDALRRFPREPGVDAAQYLLGWMAAEELRDGAALAAFEGLARRWPKSRFAVEARYRAADLEFQRERFTAAARGFAAVVKVGDTPFLALALYKQAWTALLQGRGALAGTGFEQVVILADATPADARAQILRPEAVELLAQLTVEDDLNGDGRRDADAGWPRLLGWLRGAAPHHAEVAARAADMLADRGDMALAQRVRDRLRALEAAPGASP